MSKDTEQKNRDFSQVRAGTIVGFDEQMHNAAKAHKGYEVFCPASQSADWFMFSGEIELASSSCGPDEWEKYGGYIMQQPEEALNDEPTASMKIVAEVTEQNVRTRAAFSGYLFHNPDTGTEWNISHPIESGECVDATDIQHATFALLISHLSEAWQAIAKSEAERNREIQEAEARGAAEQRRKDAEGQEPFGYVPREDVDTPKDPRGVEQFGQYCDQKYEDYQEPLYTRPANVAALEAKTERRFQHIKRGTEYRLIGRGKVQQNGPSDMAEVVIYQDVNDGSFWVRSPSEFYDGRFKEIFGSRAALTREGGV